MGKYGTFFIRAPIYDYKNQKYDESHDKVLKEQIKIKEVDGYKLINISQSSDIDGSFRYISTILLFEIKEKND